MHELKIDQHLAIGRDAVASAFSAGSSSLFKAFDGVRSEVSTRLKEREAAAAVQSQSISASSPTPSQTAPSSQSAASRSGVPIQAPQIADVRATLGNIGSGIGSFFGSRVANFRSAPSAPVAVKGVSPPGTATTGTGLRPMSLSASVSDRTSVRYSQNNG